MDKLKKKFKSVRFRLFALLCAVIVFLVLCLIIVNNVVLENFYVYSKTNTVKKLYNKNFKIIIIIIILMNKF